LRPGRNGWGAFFHEELELKRMKHPEHGFHHAYNKLEEDTMRKNGWVDDLPEAPAEVPEPEVPDAPRRPGRPRKD
jgi:hypothetical protein